MTTEVAALGAETAVVSTSGLSSYVASLSNNPYFGAGAGLFGLGFIAAFARRAAILGNIAARRRLLISMEISNEDASYEWVLRWLNANVAKATRHLSVRTEIKQSASGYVQSSFAFVPSPGDHYFWHGGRIIKVERNRESQMMRTPAGGAIGVPFETVTLTTYGTDPTFFDRMLSEARRDALKHMATFTIIYHAIGHEWRPFGNPRRKRPLESVILDDGVAEKLVDDVNDFIHNAQWYAVRGVPHRRGYLLHGPPGGGKSSFVSALASHLNHSICTLSMSERTMTDDRLNHLLNTAPAQSIILLEDIDAAFASREDHPQLAAAYEGLSRVTLSGLLNAIDGVSSAEARILVMTTNYAERLDPALIRPGRVDIQQFIGNCTQSQLTRLIQRFYIDTDVQFEQCEEMAQRALKSASVMKEFGRKTLACRR